MLGKRRDLFVNALAILAILSIPAVAQAAGPGLGSSGIMNEVLHRFRDATQEWLPAIQAAAERLFLALTVISMVWTFGLMLLKKADIGEFFAELIRFLVVFGLFWWLLRNAMQGLQLAESIVRSLSELGSTTGKIGTTDLQPSTIVDIGFELYDRTVKATDKLSWYQMGRQITMELMAIVVLVVLAVVGINLLILLASSWFLLYAGVFFLGFGGSRWTSDIALNYYRAVLGVGAQLFSMVLLVAIGKRFIEDFANRISDKMAVQELAVMLVVSVLLLLLVHKIPPMIAALVGGAGSASSGIGNFSAGAVVGAATTAVSMAGKGASAVASGGANLIGGAQAVHAAFKGAQSSVASGSDIGSRMASGLSGMLGGGTNGGQAGSPGGKSSSSESSPLSSVMGLSSSSSAGSVQSASSSGGEQPMASGGAESSASSAGGAQETVADAGGGSAAGGSNDSSAYAGAAGAQGSSTSSASKDAAGSTAGGGSAQTSSSKLGNAGRVALQTTANLISGSGRVAQARVDKSSGGKLAQAVSSSGHRASGNLDTQSKSRDFNPDAEVKSFSERKQDLT